MTTSITNNSCNFSLSNFISKTVPDYANSLADYILNNVSYINPLTQQREYVFIPSFVDIFIGNLGLSGEWCNHNEMLTTVQKVGDFLIQKGGLSSFLGFEWKFSILNSDAINAFCRPGGEICITQGLINQFIEDEKRQKEKGYFSDIKPSLEEKIAAVLSHEIIHAVSRHSIKVGQVFILISVFISPLRELLIFTIKVLYLFLMYFLPEFVISFLNSLLITFIGISFLDPNWIMNMFSSLHSQSQEFEADRLGMKLLEKCSSSIELDSSEVKLSRDSAQNMIWLSEFFNDHSSNKQPARHLAAKLAHFLSNISSYLSSTHPSHTRRIEASKETWKQILENRQNSIA